MATFGEDFELCKIPNGSELIGVEKHSENDHVILTFKNKEVLVYNVTDRKIIKSWSVEAKEKLTCPVVHQDGSYYGIKDETWLLLWEDTVPELWQSSMVMLQKPAQKIHVCMSRRFQHEPVLVFKDNDAIPFSRAGKEKKQKTSKAKERLLWCGTHMGKDSNVWFSKVLTSQDCSKVSLVMHFFKESKQHLCSIKAPEESKILCWSLVDDGEDSAFFTSFWSNGNLYKTEIPSESEKELDCELLFSVCEGPLSVSEISQVNVSHVALSFVCVASFGAGKEAQEDTVSLWDTKFRTLHAQKPTSDLIKSTSASASSTCVQHLLSTSSYVVVASDSCVSVCSYTAERSTLKSSLGILKDSVKNTSIKPQFLTTPKLIEPNQSIEEWANEVSKDDETEDEMLCRLLDSKKTKTAKKLSSELRKYFEKSTARKMHAEQPTVSQYFVTSVFERCSKDKDLWSSEIGRLILFTHVLPQRCFSQFVSLVLESNDIVLLQSCFHNLNGIPESTLVNCLKYILRCDEDIFSPCENAEVWRSMNSPCSLSRAKHLSLILSLPVNDAFLQTSLRKLNFEETLLFMKFLHYVIEHWSIHLQDVLKLQGSKHLIYAQILDWTALTLNAHFTQLTMLPEGQTLLVNLHKVVAERITTYGQLDQLDGLLMHFKNHEPFPKTDRHGAYNIETIEL